MDLTLKRIKVWTSPGSVDFDNSRRLNAATVEVPFSSHREHFQELVASNKHPTNLGKDERQRHGTLMLKPGVYLIEFNEKVDVPLHLIGQIFVRSSLFRSGALLSAGVMDSGYKGVVSGCHAAGVKPPWLASHCIEFAWHLPPICQRKLSFSK